MKLAQVDFSDPALFNTPFGKGKGLADLISLILWNSIIIAGLIMVIFIVIGGIGIIKSAGSSEEAAKGRQTATTGVIGFLIVFSTYWIIQIIEILTGIQILNPPIA